MVGSAFFLFLTKRTLCCNGGKGISKLDENACKQGDLGGGALARQCVCQCGYGGR